MPWSKPKPYCTIQKLTVRCSLNSILKSRFLGKLRIEIQEQTIENQVKDLSVTGQKTNCFLNNFKTCSCNTTQHGWIPASNCMLETRPIQVIKQMFLQGHQEQAIENWVKDWVSRQKTKDSLMTDCSIILWRHSAVTQHGMVTCAQDNTNS